MHRLQLSARNPEVGKDTSSWSITPPDHNRCFGREYRPGQQKRRESLSEQQAWVRNLCRGPRVPDFGPSFKTRVVNSNGTHCVDGDEDHRDVSLEYLGYRGRYPRRQMKGRPAFPDLMDQPPTVEGSANSKTLCAEIVDERSHLGTLAW